ncbi:MAG: polysaccharide deacetylase family protein [Bacteroidota bacterium]
MAEKMKGALRHMAKQAGRIIPFSWLNRLQYPVLLPFYHVVSNEKLLHVHNYPYRNVPEFIDELDFLLGHYKPVELHELLNPGITGKRIFHLSFDDGLRECYEVIAPILYKKGIPATFFVNPGFIGNKGLFHRYKASLIVSHILGHPEKQSYLKANGLTADTLLQISYKQSILLDEIAAKMALSWTEFLEDYRPYMTENEVKGLVRQGFTVGAHSWDHPEFWMLNADEQYHQAERSMKWVSDRFSPSVRAFAFPYTDSGISGDVISRLRLSGVCDISFGTAGIKGDSLNFHFQRFPAEFPGEFMTNLKGELGYFLLRKWAGLSTVRH